MKQEETKPVDQNSKEETEQKAPPGCEVKKDKNKISQITDMGSEIEKRERHSEELNRSIAGTGIFDF